MWLPQQDDMNQLPSTSRASFTMSWWVENELRYPDAWRQLLDQQSLQPAGRWVRFLQASLTPSPPSSPPSSPPPPPPSPPPSSPMSSALQLPSTLPTVSPPPLQLSSNSLPIPSSLGASGQCEMDLCTICQLNLNNDFIGLHDGTHSIHVRCLLQLLASDPRVVWHGPDFTATCPLCRSSVRGSIMVHT